MYKTFQSHLSGSLVEVGIGGLQHSADRVSEKMELVDLRKFNKVMVHFNVLIGRFVPRISWGC